MYKIMTSVLLGMTVTACGGGGGSAAPGPDNADTQTLRAQLSTGTSVGDTTTEWNCTGADENGAPVTFDQRLFSDGNGQLVSQGLDADGIAVTTVDGFSWAPLSASSYSISFPGEVAFTIDGITFSTINTADDQYDGIDSRDNSALNCQQPMATSVPVDPSGPTPANVLEQRLITSNTVNDLSESWSCRTADNTDINIYFWSDGTSLSVLSAGDNVNINNSTWSVDPATAALTVDGDSAVATFDSDDRMVLDTDEISLGCERSSVQPVKVLILTGSSETDVNQSWLCSAASSDGFDSSIVNNYFWADNTFATITATREPVSWAIGAEPTTILAGGQLELFTEVAFSTVDSFSARNLISQETDCERTSIQPITDVLETGISFGDNAFKWDCSVLDFFYWSDGTGQLTSPNDTSVSRAYTWTADDVAATTQYVLDDNAQVVDYTDVRLESLTAFSADQNGDRFQCERVRTQ